MAMARVQLLAEAGLYVISSGYQLFGLHGMMLNYIRKRT
jgi:hypothetical protein